LRAGALLFLVQVVSHRSYCTQRLNGEVRLFPHCRMEPGSFEGK
jgi:hypothetical protein